MTVCVVQLVAYGGGGEFSAISSSFPMRSQSISKAATNPASLSARTSGGACVTGVVCMAAVGCEQVGNSDEGGAVMRGTTGKV